MRAFGLGLATALIVAMFAGTAFAKDEIPPEAHKAGMAAAPALIESAKLPCTLVDARYMGANEASKMKVYEIACKDALGYIVAAKDKDPNPTVLDCVMSSAPDDKGKPNPMACKLPANLNPGAGLNASLTAAGRNCSVEKSRYIGSTASENIYEVGCTGSGDYILRTSKTAGTAPIASMCATFAPETGIKCGFTTPEAQMAEIDKMAAGIGQPCTVKGRRYIGSTPDHTDFFEVACSEGKGYVLQTGSNGALQQSIDCVKATELAGGCTLTDVRQAQTELVTVYTHLSQKAGFDCTVTKYAEFPAKADGTEVVELACSNRPDGGVGMFPANGTPTVVDCLRASAQGYVCNMTKDFTPVYAKLTASLKAYKASSECKIVNGQALGSTATADLIEVACADPPGEVVEISNATNSVIGIHSCSESMITGAGGCQLPGNKK